MCGAKRVPAKKRELTVSCNELFNLKMVKNQNKISQNKKIAYYC
jgi:hypothetical protein